MWAFVQNIFDWYVSIYTINKTVEIAAGRSSRQLNRWLLMLRVRTELQYGRISAMLCLDFHLGYSCREIQAFCQISPFVVPGLNFPGCFNVLSPCNTDLYFYEPQSMQQTHSNGVGDNTGTKRQYENFRIM